MFYVDKNLMLLPIFKSFDLTLKHGLCRYSPAAFVSVSFLLAVIMGDFNGGAAYARYGLILLHKLDRSEARQAEAKTLFIAYSYTLHWTQPLGKMLRPMILGYEAGIESGDVENAIYCSGSYMWTCIISGKALSAIEEDCRTYIAQMKRLKFTLSIKSFKMTRQLILNLMGRSESETTLTGEEIEEDACRKEGEQDSHTIAVLDMHKIILFSIFGKHEDGARYALEVGDSVQKASPGLLYIPLELFHRCMCLFSTARRLKQESYSRSRTRYFGWGIESKYIKTAKEGLAKIKGSAAWPWTTRKPSR